MYKIEKIGDNAFYIKALGTFPPSIAKKFVKEFKTKTKHLERFSAIIDGLDFIILALKSFKTILKLLKKNNKKLIKSAYITKNPVLAKEFELLLERAESPNRIIVDNFEDAKNWLEIKEINIQKQ
ncbi:MAG: hypothetical protein EU539_04945 [Promethearchaeota archaeon]|nr:MAG: hypothetical protein EU539_04945 [Candidatus Lokiarchaeota archaeon]